VATLDDFVAMKTSPHRAEEPLLVEGHCGYDARVRKTWKPRVPEGVEVDKAVLSRAYAETRRRALKRLADAYSDVFRALYEEEWARVTADPRYDFVCHSPEGDVTYAFEVKTSRRHDGAPSLRVGEGE
jgi:hypothetical protein